VVTVIVAAAAACDAASASVTQITAVDDTFLAHMTVKTPGRGGSCGSGRVPARDVRALSGLLYSPSRCLR
jgi:hypothetical protein